MIYEDELNENDMREDENENAFRLNASLKD